MDESDELELDEPQDFAIKVGRSVRMNKRLDEWERQCKSRELVLRGWWPAAVSDDGAYGSVNGAVSMLKGTVKPGPPGRYSHRLERE